ncbi:potassium-transporting ATPase subunit KdpC [Cohnella thailandensis]|uniref:Potassium-transporting ATPase KdpC subunit n=1 Tax=Cohnella thailandensis TaxID=557557 RepID=A0A841T2F6_9BACL|nr:potassium-transporting ATPase subunit KdpC [Cohnella thailandensis]MBB6635271.1 potassium-transporting ATPase subunit KdpC [Cohnella thailandensis]MBP1974646.1 K+-transporting ATPase ATPase C chain [Cohnella thailandensis]
MNHTASNANCSEPSGKPIIFVALRASIVFIILCGILYPLAMTGLAQLFMPHQANGSLIKDASGNTVGSELIGQSFVDPKYFQSRVSSIEYKAEASGSNNYAPSNPDMLKRTQDSIAAWQKENPDVPISELPIALITNSGSGLDPHITPQSAEVQIPRISRLTGIPAGRLEQLVDKHTEGRDLGIFGEPRVNVLKLNIDLQTLLQ